MTPDNLSSEIIVINIITRQDNRGNCAIKIFEVLATVDFFLFREGVE